MSHLCFIEFTVKNNSSLGYRTAAVKASSAPWINNISNTHDLWFQMCTNKIHKYHEKAQKGNRKMHSPVLLIDII